ncbi:MAG: leucine-rich repeat protein [Rikenellaceae bacterium]
MKNFKLFMQSLIMAFAMVFVVGCTADGDGLGSGSLQEGDVVQLTIKAECADLAQSQTKVDFEASDADGLTSFTATFEAGDAISIVDASGVCVGNLTTTEGGAEATFSGTVTLTTSADYSAVYPAIEVGESVSTEATVFVLTQDATDPLKAIQEAATFATETFTISDESQDVTLSFGHEQTYIEFTTQNPTNYNAEVHGAPIVVALYAGDDMMSIVDVSNLEVDWASEKLVAYFISKPIESQILKLAITTSNNYTVHCTAKEAASNPAGTVTTIDLSDNTTALQFEEIVVDEPILTIANEAAGELATALAATTALADAGLETDYTTYDAKPVKITGTMSTADFAALSAYAISEIDLSEVTLSETLTAASASVAYWNKGQVATNGSSTLTKITLPASATALPTNMFNACITLTDVVFPPSLATIPGNCCYGCTKLENVTWPTSVFSIAYSAFNNCAVLTQPTDDEMALMKALNAGCFSGCKSFTYFNISTSVTSLYVNVFDNCTGLTKLTIPAEVKTLTSGAFDGVTETLATIECAWTSVNMPTTFVQNVSNVISTVPDVATLQGIFPASYSKDGVNYLTFTDADVDIDAVAATVITLSDDSTTTWGECFNIKDSTGKKPGDDATTDDNDDTTPTTPTTVAITECTEGGLEALLVAAGVAQGDAIENVSVSGVMKIEDIAALNARKITNLDLSGITNIATGYWQGAETLTAANNIPSYAWNKYAGDGVAAALKTIIFPSCVIKVTFQAFYGCTNLTSATWAGEPTSNMSFEKQVFADTALTEDCINAMMKLEKFVTLGKNMFENITGVESLYIPSNVGTMNAEVFKGMDDVTSITVEGYITPSSMTAPFPEQFLIDGGSYSISVPSETIKDQYEGESVYALYSYQVVEPATVEISIELASATAIESKMTEALAALGLSYGDHVDKLTITGSPLNADIQATIKTYDVSEVDMSGVTSLQNTVLANTAFMDNTYLTKITFPSSTVMTQIGTNAFNGCTNLVDVVFSGDTDAASITANNNTVFSGCSSLSEDSKAAIMAKISNSADLTF